MKFSYLVLLACTSFSLFSLQGMALTPDENKYLSDACGISYLYLRQHKRAALYNLRSCKFKPSAVYAFLNDLLKKTPGESDESLMHLQTVAVNMNDLTSESQALFMNELSRKLAKTDREVGRLEINMTH